MTHELTSTDSGEPVLSVQRTDQLQRLPSILLSLLERRYLSEFQPELWALGSDPNLAGLVLREVVALGRSGNAEFPPSMAAALSACHEPGQALAVVVHGAPDAATGHRHHVYYGARRLPGGPAADDYLESQAGSLAAHFPGLELAKPAALGAHESLARFLRSAPALAAVTGIPSGIAGQSIPGLERLVRAVGAREYALVVVAEPLPMSSADAALDACRRLQSEVSVMTGRQFSSTYGESDTNDITFRPPPPSFSDRVPAYLQQCATYVSMISGQPILAALMIGASALTETHQTPPDSASRRESHTENSSSSESYSLVNAVARSCDELLARHASRIQAGRGWGWWRVAVYLAAESDGTLQALGRTLRAVATGDATQLDPLRLVPVASAPLRDAILHGHILPMRPVGDAPAHPLGPDYDALATCVTSEELAALVTPPRQEVPGIAIRDRGDFAVTVPTPREEAFELGRVRDAAGDDHGPTRISARALNEHVLVIGTPGSGKTNTCMHLLIQAHEQWGIPFLVIEPAKAEYRQLRRVFGERLQVLSIGDPGGRPLRLNPLAPVIGAPLLGHIDLLKAVFNASFAMGPGMPQVLEQALLEVYQDRGWDLHTGTNDAVGPETNSLDASALTPCLADLHDQVELVMQRKGYAGEVRMNIGAALKSRLHGLMLGAKGLSLNTRRPTPDADLFDRPVVLELQHLRDDEEKAFVMAAVFMRLYQYCEVRQRLLPAHRREQLQHLTLLEEAHRLLAAAPAGGDAESSNPRGKAVSMFTDMLAELRALGEGFMIAEQIPTKLTPDALKNTNLKIIHRLTALSERAAAGQSVNLNERQLGSLANLSKGLAVVHGLSASSADPVADAALVQIARVKGPDTMADLDPPPKKPARESEWRHGGCRSCPAPCEFLHRAEPELARDPRPSWIQRFAESALAGNSESGWDFWARWRKRRAVERRGAGDDYCWFVHATRTWLSTVLGARGLSPLGGQRFRPTDRLAVERLAGSFGDLARIWLERSSRDDAAIEAFAKLTTSLRTELEHGPPPDLAGCERCPAQCRMLPWIAGLDLTRAAAVVAQAIPRTVDAFGHAHTQDARWQRIEAALPSLESQIVPPTGSDPAVWLRDWKYCLMTVVDLPPEAAGHREGLLTAILKKPRAGG